jgi:hypothetical protein
MTFTVTDDLRHRASAGERMRDNLFWNLIARTRAGSRRGSRATASSRRAA